MKKELDKLKEKKDEWRKKRNQKIIKEKIKKKFPKDISKTKSIFKFKYPKLILLIILIILAYYIFKNPLISEIINRLGQLNYLGMFIAGMLFAFGFSAPFAVGFLITVHPSNIFLAAIIAGTGALTSDLLIFKWIRFSFQDEFQKIKKSKLSKEINEILNNNLGLKLKIYLIYLLAGIFIASPLPDEIGVTMLAGLTIIKKRVLAVISFVLNTLGILIILVASL